MGAFDDLIPGNSAAPAGPFDDLIPSKQAPSQDNVKRAYMARLTDPSAAVFGPLGPDVLMGARQVLDKLTQLATHGAAKLDIPGADGAAQTVDQTVNDARAGYENNYQPDAFLGSAVARGLGQMAATAPIAPVLRGAGIVRSALGGSVAGAQAGALEPVYGDTSNFWSDTVKQASQGAATGGVLGAAGVTAGKVLAPVVSDAVQTLRDAGVRTTLGQNLGGIAKSVEDKATSSPIIGDLIASRRFEGITDFNRAIYARAVEPMAAFDPAAASVAAKADVGNKGIAAVGDYLSSKYEDALSRSVPAPYDNTINEALDQIASMVPAAKQADYANVLKRELYDRFTDASTITPSVAKSADSTLGSLANEYKSSGNADDRVYAGAVRQTQTELRQLFARNNPDTAPEIQAADQGWATLVQMERAGAMAGARKDGIFTPAQYLSAVSAGGGSVRNRAMSRGEKLNQDLAQAAAQVLPSQISDSGTVGRLLLNLGAGELAHGAGLLLDPHTLGAAAVASLPYLPRIGPAVTTLATIARPQSVRSAGDLLKQIAPYLGLASAAQLAP